MVVVVFSSCSIERKLGREFLKQHKNQSILISPADILYRYNSGAYVDTLKYRTLRDQDSVAYEQSVFLRYVSDSVFLENFTNSLIRELSRLGYDVMLDASSDVFFSRPNPSWIVRLAQLQLEENYSIEYLYNDPEDEYRPVPNKLYNLTLNAWVETNPVNSHNTRKQLLYASMGISESVRPVMNFSIFSGEFVLNYSFDHIGLDDIYKMAFKSGKIHAQLLFDYFLNDYIRKNMPPGSSPRQTLHFDAGNRILRSREAERYDVVN